MLPEYSVQVDGQGTVVSDQLNTYVQSGGGLVANLRSFIGITGVVVYIIGYTAPADGGQGSFYWNATGTAPDDNGVTTIIPNGSAAGQGEWTRLPATTPVSPSPLFTNLVSFTSPGSGTFTVPNGINWLSVELFGGGGGSTSSLSGAPVAGGGGGGYANAVISVTPMQTIAYTVGAGGTASTNPVFGGNGGDTVFGTITASGGGGGGPGPGQSGHGGTATGGQLNLTGSQASIPDVGTGVGGFGGACQRGGAGGYGGDNLSGAPGNAPGGGAGGGGGVNPGMAGGNGAIYIRY